MSRYNMDSEHIRGNLQAAIAIITTCINSDKVEQCATVAKHLHAATSELHIAITRLYETSEPVF